MAIMDSPGKSGERERLTVAKGMLQNRTIERTPAQRPPPPPPISSAIKSEIEFLSEQREQTVYILFDFI